MKSNNPTIISVAVPVPLRQCFDFIVPVSGEHAGIQAVVGGRVLVSFSGRRLVGVVMRLGDHSELPLARLNPILEVIDQTPLFAPIELQLLEWVANYYLAPIGEVIELALPQLLRQGREIEPAAEKHWCLSEHGRISPIEELQRAPLQLAIVKRMLRATSLSPADFKTESGGWRQAIKALLDKGWIEQQAQVPKPSTETHVNSVSVTLNRDQTAAVSALREQQEKQGFACSLLHGVTGSGKTEVYLTLMRDVLAAGQQVLLLVPEIGLTPQLVARVSQQLRCPLSVMHSGLPASERHLAWWHARTGEAQVVIGTRSALFSSFHDLGLIVVDEEHDASFKQQEGVRYQARDVAIYRAKLLQIPILLGSATPALESYQHARSGRYLYLDLPQRATRADLPTVELLDLNHLPATDGLSPRLLESISQTLASSQQVMLFLNRRGFAPVMMCSECRHTLHCHRCDSSLTLHQRINRLRCHHCGYERVAPENCEHCAQPSLVEVGEGTQRVEEALQRRFPDACVLRIDRDSTRRKGELEAVLEQARSGGADILLGTQLLSKGHDFPGVALVGVLNADQGLYSTDFRASEHLFQQIVQVSGRAGRRAQLGRVLIQTCFPEHRLFEYVSQHDYSGFADNLLEERRAHGFPPFGYFALLRAEANHQVNALQFLRHARAALHGDPAVQVMDPIPAPMERRAGRYRAQLLLSAERRSALHERLAHWLAATRDDGLARKMATRVRWSLDIDPIDLY